MKLHQLQSFHFQNRRERIDHGLFQSIILKFKYKNGEKIMEYLSQGKYSPDPEAKDSQQNLKQNDRNCQLCNACMMQNE
jgi:hypothetical protein